MATIFNSNKSGENPWSYQHVLVQFYLYHVILFFIIASAWSNAKNPNNLVFNNSERITV
jgi:hypothetical protein